MANELYVRQGGQLGLLIQQGEPTSTSATLILRPQFPGSNITKTASYVAGFADLSLTSVETALIGVYDYQVNENIPNESPAKYPDPVKGDNCIFPTLTVCESLDGVGA